MNGLRDKEKYTFEADGEIELTRDDVIITVLSKDGYSVQSEGGMTVILDVTLTPELIREGYMREIVSKVQNMRKDAGFEVTDHIRLMISGDEEIDEVVRDYSGEICSDVLADELTAAATDVEATDVNGKTVRIGIEKI